MTINQFDVLPAEEIVQKTAMALRKNGMTVHVVNNGSEAKTLALTILPQGAEVMDMTSVTLDTIGVSQAIQESGNYISARKASYALDMKAQKKEIHSLRSIPEWTIGSVHAVTEEGTVMVASQSGSQLSAYSFGSDHVLWVVGAQKIVKDKEHGFKRIYEHCLVLESERARKAYGVPASAVNKLFILDKEIVEGRITVILVKERLGF